MIRSIALCAATVAIGLSTSAFAGDTSEAESLYSVGKAAFDAGQYDDAIAAWERSFDLSHEPALLFNLGQAYRARGRAGDCTTATHKYQQFISLQRDSDQVPAAETSVEALRSCVARENPKPVPPPEKPTPAVTSTGSARERVAGIAIAGSGVLLLASGVYFGHRASVLGDEVTAACAVGCDWTVYGRKDSDGRRAELLQYVLGSVGVAALIGGGLLFYLGRRDVVPATVSASLSPHGGTLGWSATW